MCTQQLQDCGIVESMTKIWERHGKGRQALKAARSETCDPETIFLGPNMTLGSVDIRLPLLVFVITFVE